MKAIIGIATALFTLIAADAALAQEAASTISAGEDVPIDKAITLREAASPIAVEVHSFHNAILLPVMVGISLFVLGLLVWVVLRYNRKANPNAKQFSHNTLVEVIWTGIPIFILIIIAVPSFDLLYLQDKMPDGQVNEYEAGTRAAAFPNDFAPSRKVTKERHLEVSLVDQANGAVTTLTADDYDVEGFGDEELIITLANPVPDGSRLRIIGGRSRMGQKPVLGLFGKDESQIIPEPTVTIKATGFQWGWTYSYPDFNDFEFDALIAPRDSVPSHLYRLATTNDVVVPAGETIRLVTTARDVIHAWAIPAFAVKIDSIPGRLNETWFYTEKEGTYYGQCSEICGIDHAFMPISVKVVSREEFEVWVDQQLIDNGLEPTFSGADQLAEAAPAAPAAVN